MSETLCPLLYKNLESALDNILEKDLPSVDGCAFTMNLWNSQAFQSYKSLSIHYISKSWEMKNYSIGCRNCEGDHTGESTGTFFDNLLATIPALRIETSKVTTTATDSNLFQELRDSTRIDTHLLCLDQILNGCLEFAFSVPPVSASIQKCQELAAFAHQSILCLGKIRDKCEALDGESEAPYTDTDTELAGIKVGISGVICIVSLPKCKKKIIHLFIKAF